MNALNFLIYFQFSNECESSITAKQAYDKLYTEAHEYLYSEEFTEGDQARISYNILQLLRHSEVTHDVSIRQESRSAFNWFPAKLTVILCLA